MQRAIALAYCGHCSAFFCFAQPSISKDHALISAARSGDRDAVWLAIASGASVDAVIGGESALTSALSGWHHAIMAWPVQPAGRWGEVLDTLLAAGASPAVMCPYFDSIAYRNVVALGALTAASNISTLVYCLTARKGRGGGSISHHIARSPIAGVSRALFRSRRIDVDPRTLAELATALNFAEGMPQWEANPGFIGDVAMLTKAAIERAAGASELQVISGALARVVAAMGNGARASAFSAAVLAPMDASGLSPLDTACAEGREDVAVWLAAHGGGVETAGSRCAHFAAARGYATMITALAGVGSVSVAAADAHGRTPCDVARGLGLLGQDAAAALRAAGACVASEQSVGDNTLQRCPRARAEALSRGPTGPLYSFDACLHSAAGWHVASPDELHDMGLPRDLFDAPCSTGSRGVNVSSEEIGTETGLPHRREEGRLVLERQLASGRWCPVDVLPASALAPTPSAQQALATDYLDLGRPFLVAGAVDPVTGVRCYEPGSACDVGPLAPLSRAALTGECGELEVAWGEIPLAEAYGRRGMRSPMGEFLHRQMGPRPDATHAQLRAPPYIFDTEILRLPRARRLRDAAAPLHSALVGRTSALPPAREQFGAGPPLSGAPPHFHRAAVNVLLAGVKLWAVWPPGAAAFADGSALAFWRSFLRSARSDSDPAGAAACFLFLQGPGDAVYLPPHWGHATLNLADSVGVALE